MLVPDFRTFTGRTKPRVPCHKRAFPPAFPQICLKLLDAHKQGVMKMPNIEDRAVDDTIAKYKEQVQLVEGKHEKIDFELLKWNCPKEKKKKTKSA